MKLEERLIVAADFSPEKCGGISGVHHEVLELATELKGLGVYIKVNSVLRAIGYSLIDDLHDLGLKVFADLKLIDIPATMEIDGEMLEEVQPEIVTCMCCAGIDGMHKLKQSLSKTDVFGVTVLTSLNEEECQAIFTCSTKAGVLKFGRMAQLAGLGDLILSPKETKIIKNRFELTLGLNTPGIRPEWGLVKGDDQSRILTPKKAIEGGAKRIVIGRPITQAGSSRDAVLKTLDEINEGIEAEKRLMQEQFSQVKMITKK